MMHSATRLGLYCVAARSPSVMYFCVHSLDSLACALSKPKRMTLYRIFVILFLFFISTAAVAWNATGHKIVALIAYERLTPTAKMHIDRLSMEMSHARYADSRFLTMAVWPDYIKKRTSEYNAWHYINLPLTNNNAPNVVWAIQYVEHVLESSSGSTYHQSKNLAFLIHFIGDIHQPLHCMTSYSGGNLFTIRSPIANNLHALWDRGLGFFSKPDNKRRLGFFEIRRIANAWTAKYPPTYFGDRINSQFPMQWAQESHRLAIQYAYDDLLIDSTPSSRYISAGKHVVEEQTVLAGYRLANVLNRIFSH